MKNEKLKIIFIGTPEFSKIILKNLIEKNIKPVLVITSTDKPVGRKQILTHPPVKILAQENNIPVLQPENIKNLKLKIKNLNPDLGIVAAYSQIIPNDILKIPKYGFINVHPSLLPKYRGSSPIQYAILNGDKETGVTIMLMDEKLDHGPIISSVKCDISENENAQTLEKKLAELGSKLLIETIPSWVDGKIKPEEQDHLNFSYAGIIKKEDGKINWNDAAEAIERKIRAFIPWPGVYTFFQNKKLKILSASVLKQSNPSSPLGKIFLTSEDRISVQTGKDLLVIKKLQIEGGKEMEAKEFLRGHLNFLENTLE